MKFTFTEKKMGTSEELRAYTERKVGKLDRFFKTESSANITFSMERGRFLAEITVSNNGLYYRASELTNDMYASVDSGVAAIERQIRKNKTRLEKRLREGALEKEARPSFALIIQKGLEIVLVFDDKAVDAEGREPVADLICVFAFYRDFRIIHIPSSKLPRQMARQR